MAGAVATGSAHNGWPRPEATGLASGQARRNRARRMILAGAWVLDRRAGLPAIETLLRTELANFLRRDRTPPHENHAILRFANLRSIDPGPF